MSTSTAEGIIVHRCVVRVVRRGGWSWGPDPQNLVRRVVDALPDLLADRFADHLAEHPDDDGPDLVITEPVRVTVRLGRSSGSAVVVEAAHDAADPVVVEVVPVAPEPTGLGDAPAVARVSADDVTPATLFAELAERDELAALLALLPDSVLVTYVTALLGHAPRDADGTVIGEVVAELTRRGSPASPPTDRAGLLRLLGSLPETASAAEVPEAATRTETSVPAPVAVGETRVCGALPFLLAGQLARTGYLGAIGPALAGAGLLGEAPLFAAALAYKVLGAPARGWRRTGADHATAAAFSGLESVPDLGAFARRVRQALPVLDGVLALNACRGHDPEDPLVVTGVDDGLLLVDAQGMFPISWAPDVAGLLPYWTACGQPPVAVCDSPLPSDCLRDLASAGVGFVTDARPLRGDPVTRLPWRTPLWTAGDPGPRLAAALPGHADRVDELVREVFTGRRAVPRADGAALEHTVALAASLGLGMVAWALWRDRETTDPVAALTRFADLEATVRYAAETVHVTLPLGRRHADLLHHGALTDVHDVVWLSGRTLTFSGG
ncbi:MAG: hypothetical protein WBA97_22605 [Actinophytocola sp.]|uniref:hypothetical protein n=1 Tax=Actinophytocola sp. TaxID=1872138 RepID=UPI003C71F5AB